MTGWQCDRDNCGAADTPAPRKWPHPCRECGHPADPTFAEPWAHDARIHRIRKDLHSPDEFRRRRAEAEQHVWAYRDACYADDRAAMAVAWTAWLATERFDDYEMLTLATVAGDVDRVFDQLLGRYPLIDTRDLEEDNQRRTKARQFLSDCIRVLVHESTLEHPRAPEILAAVRDVAGRSDSVLMEQHHRGFQQLSEMLGRRGARAAIARGRAGVVSGLPPVTRRGRSGADAAIEEAELHDDFGPLDDLIGRAEPGLGRILRARRHLARGDLPAATAELDSAGGGSNPLRAQILATYGLLVAQREQVAGQPVGGGVSGVGGLDRGIALCRAGRVAGLRWWRRVTAADAALGRLLVRRALRAENDNSAAEIREAARLIRRRCRPWHRPTADEKLLLQEALAARDALTGHRSDARRQRAWSEAVNVPPDIPARARIAVAWAEWAAGTDVPEFAAEAYGKLVALSAQDAAARRGASARERVLAASQEYAEEAGYWLARAGKYREAALALETGRAIGLTGSPDKVRYADITSQTGDGALVYLAAARAGGYALVVAATHDPQYVDLPRLDRATVAGITGRLIGRAAGNVAAGPTPPADRLPQGLTTRMTGPAPAAGQLPTTGRTGAAPAAERLVRDLGMAANDTGVADPVDGALRALWEGGVRDLLMHARGRVVTLVPLGLLNLLPLHAAGGTGHDDEWRHAGIFSAIRYAPNARALGRCRDNARHLTGAEHTLLTIDVPDSPGQPNLPYVAREALEVARRWTGGGVRSIRSCTWDEFRAAAGSATVWHLACHGSAEPGNILESRLCFADRAVTLAELTGALRPGPRRLAVLSACQTNVVGAALPNEVVGLPSALVQLGFAGVIATAWPVDDLATAFLMTRFYEFWRHDGNDPPTALNQAQEWLRTATPSDLLAALPGVHPPAGPEERPYAAARFWAAFACTGA